MARDLRELFAKEREEKEFVMKSGHEDRFLSKLEKEMPQRELKGRSGHFWQLGVAASIALVCGLGVYFWPNSKENIPVTNPIVLENETINQDPNTISLGDLSPDLKKVESYYVTHINLELSDIEFTDSNKIIVDGYMERLAELDKEYKRLNTELNEIGPNDQTIEALIKNLQLRLQLLQKLKSKLNHLKSSKNEHESSNIV